MGAVDHSKADEISTQRYPPVVVLVQHVSIYIYIAVGLVDTWL